MTNPMIIDGEEYVSLKEAAEILSVNTYKAKEILIRNKEFDYNKHTLPIIRRLVNKTLYFKKSDIENINLYFKEYKAITKKYDKIIQQRKIRDREKISVFL